VKPEIVFEDFRHRPDLRGADEVKIVPPFTHLNFARTGAVKAVLTLICRRSQSWRADSGITCRRSTRVRIALEARI